MDKNKFIALVLLGGILHSQAAFLTKHDDDTTISRISLPNVLQLDDDGKFVLGWEFNAESDSITFEIEAETTGYVGFGVSPQGSMLDADIFIAGVDPDGVPYYSVSKSYFNFNKASLTARKNTFWLCDFIQDRIGIGFTTPKVDDHED